MVKIGERDRYENSVVGMTTLFCVRELVVLVRLVVLGVLVALGVLGILVC